MFAGTISRDDGEPWGPTGMSTALWMDVETELVPMATLWATQAGILLAPLIDPSTEPVGRDPFPHVIRWRGRDYLEDGHHRAVRAMLNGHTFLRVRVLTVPDSQEAAP